MGRARPEKRPASIPLCFWHTAWHTVVLVNIYIWVEYYSRALQIVSVIHCCVTNDYKFSSLQHIHHHVAQLGPLLRVSQAAGQGVILVALERGSWTREGPTCKFIQVVGRTHSSVLLSTALNIHLHLL